MHHLKKINSNFRLVKTIMFLQLNLKSILEINTNLSIAKCKFPRICTHYIKRAITKFRFPLNQVGFFDPSASLIQTYLRLCEMRSSH